MNGTDNVIGVCDGSGVQLSISDGITAEPSSRVIK